MQILKLPSMLQVFLCVLTLVLLHVTEPQAEGGGKRAGHNWGANRRVKTQESGFVGVKGTFEKVEMSLPKDENGKITKDSNAMNSKPSFYLGGGGGGVEVDAGMQYEWLESGNPERPESYVPPSWAAFISVSKKFRNPQTWNGSRYVPWRNTDTSSYSLEYKVYNDQEICPETNQAQPKGAVSLKVNNLLFFWKAPPDPEYPGPVSKPFLVRPYTVIPPDTPDTVLPPEPTFTYPTDPLPTGPPPNPAWAWPWQGESHALSTNLHNARPTLFAKRVVCITQDTGRPAENDGSTFTCTFSGGRLVKANSDEYYWNPLAHAEDVDQGANATGYDTPTEGRSQVNVSLSNPLQKDHAKDLTWYGFETPSSIYKIRFPNVHFNPSTPGDPQDVARKDTLSLENKPSETKIFESSDGTGNGGNIRYTRETVAISLRNASRALATPVQPAPVNSSSQ